MTETDLRKESNALMTLSEAHFQRTCTELLERDGWRSLRTDPVSNRAHGKGFGEKGMSGSEIWMRLTDLEPRLKAVDESHGGILTF